MPVYLAGTCRPQGFSPSRRFFPTDTSWLYFKPLPSIGFRRPSELFPLAQAGRLSAPRYSPAVTWGFHEARWRTTANRLFSRPDFRALLRSSVRHPRRMLFTSARAAALLAFPSSPGLTKPTVGPRPSPLVLRDARRTVRRGHFRVSIRPSLGSSTREDPASMRLSTLRNRPTRGREPDNQQLLCRRGV
jgi:hypothetical protein